MSETRTVNYRTVRVSARGGQILLGCWGLQGKPVLAVHGVTSSHRAFDLLAGELGGRRVVAPDLRGRGASSELPGPYGLDGHADDLVRVLDAVRAEQAIVVGHSMGAFVAVTLAHRHPGRVERLVLVDGGIPLTLPPGVTAEDPSTLLGPAAERLRRSFVDVEAYRQFMRAHPALGPYWNDSIQSYVDYDVAGAPPQLRPRTRYEAMREDSVALVGDPYRTAFAGLNHRTTFLRAERGMLDQPRGLYSPEQVDAAVADHPTLRAVTVPDVNHYTIVLSRPGAVAVAAAVTGRPERPPTGQIPTPRTGPPSADALAS